MFRLSETPIDVALERHLLLPQAQAGGYAAFEGWVRNHHQGRAVTGLRYEAYIPLAVRRGAALVQEAAKAFDLRAAAAVHRVGELQVGDVAVWIGVAAQHRGPAFDACRWLIDRIKDEVPIWKYERYLDAPPAWIADPLV